MSYKKVNFSEIELSYLKFLIESELFKLKGVQRVVKKPEVNKTLGVAQELQKKLTASV